MQLRPQAGISTAPPPFLSGPTIAIPTGLEFCAQHDQFELDGAAPGTIGIQFGVGITAAYLGSCIPYVNGIGGLSSPLRNSLADSVARSLPHDLPTDCRLSSLECCVGRGLRPAALRSRRRPQ